MKKSTHSISLLFVLVYLITGCSKLSDLTDLDQALYKADYALPLINTNISIGDVLTGFQNEAALYTDNEGVLHFNYQGGVIQRTSDDIFRNINRSLPPLIPVLSHRMPLPFSSPDGLDIDRLDLRSGQLIYAFQSKKKVKLNVTITFPEVTKNGQPLVINQIIFPYSGSGSLPTATNLFSPLSLSGYTINAPNDTAYIEYKAVSDAGIPDTLTNFVVQFKDLSFTYAEGYLGSSIFEGGRDTLYIDFFETWKKGKVYFEDPIVTMHIENSFGIPTRSVINVFDIFTADNKILPLESEFVTQGIDFPYPTMSEIGQIKTKSFAFTKENSNIDEVLGASPVALDYDVDAITNPDRNIGIKGFITDKSFYKVRMEVDLPLYGKASGFLARDTFEIRFDEYKKVEAAEFKLVGDNGLPLEVDLQGYFIDFKGNTLDSLLSNAERVLDPAETNIDGEVTKNSSKITFVTYSKERFEHIKQAEKLILHATFSTGQGGATSVKLKSSQLVNIRLGAILTVSN